MYSTILIESTSKKSVAQQLAWILFFLSFSFLLANTMVFSEEQPGIDARFKQILEMAKKGDSEAYLHALLKFLEEYPNSTVTDAALFKLGELYLSQGNWRQGAETFQRLLRDFPLSNLKNDALYMLAYCQMKNGMLRDAQIIAEGLLKGSPDTLAPSLKIKTEALIKEITSIQSSQPLIAVPQPSPLNYRLGVVLPLSGRYAAFGEQALKGIVLAAGIFESKGQSHAPHPVNQKQESEGLHIEIIIKDTRDDPLASEKAVEELVLNEGVVGIIGPLLSITAAEAAKKAQELKTPMITLAQKEGLTGAGDYIFRNFLSPSEQAKAIAAYAIQKLNYKKFAILYPNSPYGTELANFFKEEIKTGNGEIVSEEQYTEGQTYFGKEIVKLFKIKESEKKEGRRNIKTFETGVTVDALYIPEYYDTIGLIAPHLAYYNVKDIKLLGSNGWNSPKLIELAGKFVEGAIFTDGFFVRSKREITAQFVDNFKSLYGTEPGIIEAQAYDATRIMADAVLGGEKTREEIRNSLVHVEDFHGATGDITFNKEREAVKEPFLLTVKNGRIVEIH